MRETLQPFIDATGIDVEYIDSPAFDTEITTRVEGGDLPDIAFFPQPGLLLDIADQTGAVPRRRVPRHRRPGGEPDPWLPRRRDRPRTGRSTASRCAWR